MMRGSRTHKRFHRKKSTLFWIALAALAVLIVLLRLTVFHTVRIEGSSMEHTLSSGDVVLVTTLGKPERGDIVECRFPGRSGTYVKRLVGLPGETVVIRGGMTYIDGYGLAEPYLSSDADDYSITLGEDQYLLLGDHRAESYDSREADMGPVSGEDLIGKVRCVLWPPRSIS